jgi:choline-sulfatase
MQKSSSLSDNARRGNYKYISCSTDPKLLFNLELDPDEKNNLAVELDYAEVIAEFDAEIAAKWNEGKLVNNIVTSQKRRILIREAQKSGTSTRWNHYEIQGDKVLWYRGEGSYNEWAFDYLPVGKQ